MASSHEEPRFESALDCRHHGREALQSASREEAAHGGLQSGCGDLTSLLFLFALLPRKPHLPHASARQPHAPRALQRHARAFLFSEVAHLQPASRVRLDLRDCTTQTQELATFHESCDVATNDVTRGLASLQLATQKEPSRESLQLDDVRQGGLQGHILLEYRKQNKKKNK